MYHNEPVSSNTPRNYDFTIRSNAVVKSSELINSEGSTELNKCMHSRELKRKLVLAELHDSYASKFKEIFYTNIVPKDSLNRFLYEQFSLSRLSDGGSLEHSSCLIKPENIVFMDTLKKEICTAYPLVSRAYSLIQTDTNWKAQSKIKAYLTLAKSFLDNDVIQPENQETYKKMLITRKTINDFENNFDSNQSERFKERFEEMFHKCKRYFEPRCSLKIKEISEFLNTTLSQVAYKLKSIVDETNESSSDSIVACIESPRSVELRFNEVSFKISLGHYQKLRKLYEKNAEERSGIQYDENTFKSRVFSLVCRYESYFQNSVELNEGYGMQAAVPSYAFKKLAELFEVSQELFASPFNCYFSQYCSAFLDTDVYFGSQGSFFDYEPSGGSFQCNPPFTEECIELMATRIEHLLQRANENPLSFIVFIPEWLDPPTPGLVKMSDSKYCRRELTLMRGDHGYITGAQYLDNKKSLFYPAAHNSKIYFLQNDLAFRKWEPAEDKIRQLERCLRTRINDATSRNNSYGFKRRNEDNRYNLKKPRFDSA